MRPSRPTCASLTRCAPASRTRPAARCGRLLPLCLSMVGTSLRTAHWLVRSPMSPSPRCCLWRTPCRTSRRASSSPTARSTSLRCRPWQTRSLRRRRPSSPPTPRSRASAPPPWLRGPSSWTRPRAASPRLPARSTPPRAWLPCCRRYSARTARPATTLWLPRTTWRFAPTAATAAARASSPSPTASSRLATSSPRCPWALRTRCP